MSDLVGRTLGKYRIVARLGRGGMAEVYKAYQPGLNRYVAVKVLHGHLADDEDFIFRFFRRNDLRMPTTAEFFAHGGILCASYWNETRITRHADVAADAFADVFVPAFFDLVRQERVGNGWTCRTDEVHDAALDGGDHAIG